MTRDVCSIEGCRNPIKTRKLGLCGKHNERVRAHGSPHVNLTGYGLPPIERFMPKVERRADGCWLWLANIDEDGYGVFKVDGKNRKAHRWSYEHHMGPIPDGLDLDHLCRVRNCVNPAHLEPVTTGENQRRGLNGVLRTHCRNGHAYEGNVKLNSVGRRECVICTRAAQARYRSKEKAS